MFLNHDVERVLTDRIKALESKSQDYALQAESGKLMPALLTVGSVAASIINPTAPLFALIGAAGYVASVMLDHHNTGRLTPIPCKRSSFREIREELLSDEPIVKSLFDTTIDSLDPGDRQEYFVLTRGIDFLKTMLNSVSPEHREALYEQAWRNPRNYFPTDLRVVEVLESADPPALPASSVIINNNNEVKVSPTIAAPVVHVSVAHAPAEAHPAPVAAAPTTTIAPTVAPRITRSSFTTPAATNCGIPFYRVHEQIVQETIERVTPGHLFLACKTGSGKSTTIKALIRTFCEQTKESVEFVIVDPKGSQWLGLDVLRITDKNTSELLALANAIKSELDRRIELREQGILSESRLIFVLDEFVTLLLYAEHAGIKKDLLKVLNLILALGREDKVNLWVIGQSHLVQDSGFNTAMRGNFEIYSQGMPGNLESVRRMIADRSILPDNDRAIELSQSLEKYENEKGQSPVMFSSRYGGKLFQLPDLTKYVEWSVTYAQDLNPSTTKLNPMQIPDCKVAKVMQAIDACTTPSGMASFFDLDDSGQPKSIAALALWNLVKNEGVARAIEVMLPSEESYGEMPKV